MQNTKNIIENKQSKRKKSDILEDIQVFFYTRNK
jgi:hypothetical protein